MTQSQPRSLDPSRDRPLVPHRAPPLAPDLPESPLDGLVDLACRDGVDVRPTLLRVLTDLYVQKPSHSAFEQIQYVELALGLVDGVDDATRAAVAASLAAYPAAPAAVLDRLAGRTGSSAETGSHDAAETAGPTVNTDFFARERYQESEAFFASDIFSDAVEPAADHSTESYSIERKDSHESQGPDQSQSASESRNVSHGDDALLTDDDCEDEDLADLFFRAGPDERCLILLNLDAVVTTSIQLTPPAPADIVTRLENAAFQRRIGDFADTLAGALGIGRDIAERIARDPFGEPTVVAAKALAMKAAVLQRILLFLNPVVGQSVQRVYALAALYNDMTREAAERMLAIWRQASLAKPAGRPAAARDAVYEPVYDGADRSDSRGRTATPRRRNPSAATRRPKPAKATA